jgi:hypothetical protein
MMMGEVQHVVRPRHVSPQASVRQGHRGFAFLAWKKEASGFRLPRTVHQIRLAASNRQTADAALCRQARLNGRV